MSGENTLAIMQLSTRDLIVAIADAALQVTEDEDQAQEIAGLVLKKLVAGMSDYMLASCSTTSIQ